MSKLEESAKNVIDEILGNDVYLRSDEEHPTRREDSITLLYGCSKILKGSYKQDKIDKIIMDFGFSVQIVKTLPRKQNN